MDWFVGIMIVVIIVNVGVFVIIHGTSIVKGRCHGGQYRLPSGLCVEFLEGHSHKHLDISPLSNVLQFETIHFIKVFFLEHMLI